MYRRKCYEKLLEWKRRSNGKTAVLVEGARRVGKTTLVKEFAAREYQASICIDFSKASNDILNLFREQRADIDTFLRMLQLISGVMLEPRRSVVVLDEVQRFPVAREYVKHLVADGRFDYIETGSLISIKKNVENIVIPSEEERIALNPLDFEEYLWAAGLDIYAEEIRHRYSVMQPLEDAVHRKIERHFNEYMLVGGMPQSVEAFLDDADFRGCDRVKRQILSLYMEDMAKFGGGDARRARAIFQEIPGELSAASKRFRFAGVQGGGRYETLESAFIWLEDAHLVNICRLCTDPSVGYRLHADETSLKCYMADTGLLVSWSFGDGPASLSVHRDIQLGRVSVNKGMLVENVVAQQLHASGHSLFYFSWQEPSKTEGSKPRPREVDFLITREFADAAGKLRICPVEVKSSKAYATVSLDDFGKRFKERTGNELVLHPKNLRIDGNRRYLPLYMAHLL